MNDGITESGSEAGSTRPVGIWIPGPVDPLISPHFPLVRAEMREMREAYWIWNGLDPTSLGPGLPDPGDSAFEKFFTESICSALFLPEKL